MAASNIRRRPARAVSNHRGHDNGEHDIPTARPAGLARPPSLPRQDTLHQLADLIQRLRFYAAEFYDNLARNPLLRCLLKNVVLICNWLSKCPAGTQFPLLLLPSCILCLLWWCVRWCLRLETKGPVSLLLVQSAVLLRSVCAGMEFDVEAFHEPFIMDKQLSLFIILRTIVQPVLVQSVSHLCFTSRDLRLGPSIIAMVPYTQLWPPAARLAIGRSHPTHKSYANAVWLLLSVLSFPVWTLLLLHETWLPKAASTTVMLILLPGAAGCIVALLWKEVLQVVPYVNLACNALLSFHVAQVFIQEKMFKFFMEHMGIGLGALLLIHGGSFLAAYMGSLLSDFHEDHIVSNCFQLTFCDSTFMLGLLRLLHPNKKMLLVPLLSACVTGPINYVTALVWRRKLQEDVPVVTLLQSIVPTFPQLLTPSEMVPIRPQPPGHPVPVGNLPNPPLLVDPGAPGAPLRGPIALPHQPQQHRQPPRPDSPNFRDPPPGAVFPEGIPARPVSPPPPALLPLGPLAGAPGGDGGGAGPPMAAIPVPLATPVPHPIALSGGSSSGGLRTASDASSTSQQEEEDKQARLEQFILYLKAGKKRKQSVKQHPNPTPEDLAKHNRLATLTRNSGELLQPSESYSQSGMGPGPSSSTTTTSNRKSVIAPPPPPVSPRGSTTPFAGPDLAPGPSKGPPPVTQTAAGGPHPMAKPPPGLANETGHSPRGVGGPSSSGVSIFAEPPQPRGRSVGPPVGPPVGHHRRGSSGSGSSVGGAGTGVGRTGMMQNEFVDDAEEFVRKVDEVLIPSVKSREDADVLNTVVLVPEIPIPPEENLSARKASKDYNPNGSPDKKFLDRIAPIPRNTSVSVSPSPSRSIPTPLPGTTAAAPEPTHSNAYPEKQRKAEEPHQKGKMRTSQPLLAVLAQQTLPDPEDEQVASFGDWATHPVTTATSSARSSNVAAGPSGPLFAESKVKQAFLGNGPVAKGGAMPNQLSSTYPTPGGIALGQSPKLGPPVSRVPPARGPTGAAAATTQHPSGPLKVKTNRAAGVGPAISPAPPSPPEHRAVPMDSQPDGAPSSSKPVSRPRSPLSMLQRKSPLAILKGRSGGTTPPRSPRGQGASGHVDGYTFEKPRDLSGSKQNSGSTWTYDESVEASLGSVSVAAPDSNVGGGKSGASGTSGTAKGGLREGWRKLMQGKKT